MVHAKLKPLQPHCWVLHGCWLLQLHLMSFSNSAGVSCVVSGTVIGARHLEPYSQNQPCSVGSSSGGFGCSVCHHIATCRCAHMPFCLNDSNVGGSDSGCGALAILSTNFVRPNLDACLSHWLTIGLAIACQNELYWLTDDQLHIFGGIPQKI